MISTRRLRKVVGLLASASSIGMSIGLWGCNPSKDQIRPDNIFQRIGRQTGEIIEPRRCEIRVWIIDRPFGDLAINQATWKAADEQEIPLKERRALEINGLKIGEITGELPVELESVLNAPPPHKVDPATIQLEDGQGTLISLGDPVDQISLLLNREGRAYGKDYEAASGFFRVIATHDGTNSVHLRFTPEIHHGPLHRSFPALNNGGPYAPQQFKINDGQQEDALRDLSATITLEPNQIAVVGCLPEQPRSLGAFLLTRPEGKGDLRRQKLILVSAARNQLGTLGDKSVRTDRPRPSLITGLADGMPTAFGAKTPDPAAIKAEAKKDQENPTR